MDKEAGRTLLILLTMVLVCSAFNLTKAYHIDDTAYLETARAILANPMHPMSGMVNWGSSARPVYHLNQPHLMSYVLAVMMRLLGDAETWLHLLMIPFVFLVAVFFCRTARIVAQQDSLYLTATLVLGPAFLPSQNLMTDVPVLACWVVFYWALLDSDSGSRSTRYLLAAIAISVAVMIKYVSLALVPVFLVVLVLRGHWRQALYVLIPLSVIACWSMFNYLDYGGVHILTRSREPMNLREMVWRSVAWLAGLGAVSTFTICMLPLVRRNATVTILFFGSALVTGAVATVARLRYRCPRPDAFLWGLFIGNGVLAVGAAVWGLAREFRTYWAVGDRTRVEVAMILGLWLAGACGFVVLLAPFVAIRHILLAMPPVLLLSWNSGCKDARVGLKRIALTSVTALGILAATSDHVYAGVYKHYSRILAADTDGHGITWSVGHWGWQWYSVKYGMRQYDAEGTVLTEGDRVIVPRTTSNQDVTNAHMNLLRLEREVVIAARPLTWLRLMGPAPAVGFYALRFPSGLPWRVTREPLEVFDVYVVGRGRGVSRQVSRSMVSPRGDGIEPAFSVVDAPMIFSHTHSLAYR
jgi:hypothetical protein